MQQELQDTERIVKTVFIFDYLLSLRLLHNKLEARPQCSQ